MRKFLVIAVLAGLALLFVIQKRNQTTQPTVTAAKPAGQTVASTSPRPVSEHNWMKRSLDRTNEVKRQVAQQRREDGTR
jgi:hypothetical protein